jgi:hypothetical protein
MFAPVRIAIRTRSGMGETVNIMSAYARAAASKLTS